MKQAMLDALKNKKQNSMKIEIEIQPKEDENKVMGMAPDLKGKDSADDGLEDGEKLGVEEGELKNGKPKFADNDMYADEDKKIKMDDAAAALKGNMDESDEIQFERMIDRGEQPKSMLDKAKFKMYADKKGYQSK